jgi:hypothetical protein
MAICCYIIFYNACQVGWIVTAFFTIIATITSFWLVDRHLQWYTNVRLLIFRCQLNVNNTISSTEARTAM